MIARSFIDKPNGSNFMEHELSVVKRRIERRIWMRLGANRTSLR
jgi:hypothetical protein